MIEIESYSTKAPRMGAIAVISVGVTSARDNLADAAELGDLCKRGKFVTLKADALCYVFLNNADSGTADGAATSGANRTYALHPGVAERFLLTNDYTWLVHIAPVATVIRAFVSSLDGEGN